MNLVNLTPHRINVMDAHGSIVTIEPSGEVARLESHSTEVGIVPLDNPNTEIVLYEKDLGIVMNVPEPKENTLYIVSMAVASALRRKDVVSPGELIRDDEGKPVACEGFSTFSG